MTKMQATSKDETKAAKIKWLKKLLAKVRAQEISADYQTRWRIAAAIEPIIKELEDGEQ